jgi:hypothetical protein
MKGQATLTAFSGPDQFREPTKMIYDCQNCVHFRGFVPGPKVNCMGRNKEIPKNGCACWSDGKELEFMDSIAPPADFVAKKYAGQS